MIQVRCPKCSASLALKQAPAAGKVKCPKCAAIIAVGNAAPPAAPPGAARKPAGPATKAATYGTDEIDFRSIPSSSASAPSGDFPVPGTRKIYDGPIALDPIPKQRTGDEDGDEDEDEDETSQPNSGGNKKKSKQATTILALVAVVVALVAGGGVAFWKFGSGGSGAASVDVGALAAAAAPSGYEAKMFMNCVTLMPKGSWGKKTLPSAIESVAVQSDATQSVFFLGVMDGGSQPIDDVQMKKKAGRLLGGEVLGGQPVERNGYKGIKGVIDGSLFVPRLSIEVFHHDGRFAIIGYAAGSALQAAGGGGGAVVGGTPEEQTESDVFYNSFKIGPPPGGFFSN